MSAPGVKPTPAALRLVKQGATAAALAAAAAEPKVTADLKPAPAWMNKAQRAIWDQKVQDCPPGMLRALDDDLLASYVVAVVERDLAVRKLQQCPSRVVQTKKGNWVQSPYVGMVNRQTLIIAKLGSELGFSPTSRSRIKVKRGAGEENPFEAHAAKNRRA